MSNNLIICGIIVLLISTLMQSSNNQDNLTTLLYVVLICGIIYTLNQNGNLVNNTGAVKEPFGGKEEFMYDTEPEDKPDTSIEKENHNVQATAVHSGDSGRGGGGAGGGTGSSCDLDLQFDNRNPPPMMENDFEKITAGELLPQKDNTWPSQPTVQSTASDELFFDAQSIIGMSSNVLRNASYDLRCAPSNPRVDVGPWQQTTMEPDLTRRPLEGPECGACNSGTSTDPSHSH